MPVFPLAKTNGVRMMQRYDVVVLLSTYNGKKYIREQIETICNQDYQGHIHLYIRDDGSKDETVLILNDIKESLPSNRSLEVCASSNVGPQRSFLKLIKTSPQADYYFFADQDDVWDLDKVSKAVNKMSENKEEPTAYCCNYRLSDMDLKILDAGFIKKTPKFTPLRVIFYNEIPGCTMGFNDSLMQYLRALKLHNCMMHDSLAVSLAAHCGTVIFDKDAGITHRIHADNVVGAGHKKIVPTKWIKEKLNLLIKKDDYDISEMADQFLKVCANAPKRQFVEDLELLRDFKKNYANTFRLLHHPDSKDKITDRTTMSIRCKILFHIF